jgi:pimeloyl-ACP methyl ester carboxylesterase
MHDIEIGNDMNESERREGLDRRLFLKASIASAAALQLTGATPAHAEGEITHRFVDVNGIKLHIAEQGEGPLVILCHGWPEFWYSWKEQIPVLAKNGYRVVAPDMRGYGQSSAPEDIAAYSLFDTVGDMVALVKALGEQKAIIVGHDFGATAAWTAALLRPDVFPAVAGLASPYRPRGPMAPVETFRKSGAENFYWVYFQKPGVAEAEFERDIPSTFRHLMYGKSKSSMVQPGKGFLDLLEISGTPAPWMTEKDIALYAEAYQRSGFRGGLNWYRNKDRDWALLAPWQDVAIRQPALFIAGANDGGIKGAMADYVTKLSETVPGLKKKVLIDDAGHWVQLEKPKEVNDALLDFLGEFGRPAVSRG